MVYATPIADQLGAFEEELCIETERIGLRYFFKIRGDAETSQIDASKFRDVQFGSCLVNEEAKRVLEIDNTGGYPCEFEIKTNYPIKVSPLKGTILGHTKQQFVVSWTPTGGYKMKATVHCYASHRVYDFVCKGVGAYPRFILRNNFIDFGVGAIGVEYTRYLQIINRGQLNLTWNVPPLVITDGTNQNGSPAAGQPLQLLSPTNDNTNAGGGDAITAIYRIEPSTGVLRPNEETSVAVVFKPLRAGVIYSSDPIVESKGRHRDVSILFLV